MLRERRSLFSTTSFGTRTLILLPKKEYGLPAGASILSIITKPYGEQLRRERDPATKPIFTKAETEPSFAGDWQKFLQKNLDATVPVKKGVKPGTYKVEVQFIVDETGKLSDITPLTKRGFGMEEEVVRLMKTSPDWIPAKQNGRNVTAYKKQTVTFFFLNN
jgi:protein TonB